MWKEEMTASKPPERHTFLAFCTEINHDQIEPVKHPTSLINEFVSRALW
jgi:hypothetical protein